MTPRSLSRVAGILGGLCWVGRAVLDELRDLPEVVNALHWGGLALIAIALVGIGAGLVSSGAVWLRVLVAICLPALAWSVVEALHAQTIDRWVDAVFGLLLALFCAGGLLRGRKRTEREPRRHVGSHRS